MIKTFDRLITIQKRTITRDAAGGVVETWATTGTWYAAHAPLQAREVEANQRQTVTRRANFTTHYRTDINEADYRIQYGGHDWDIIGILEVGRRRFITISCQTTS